MRGMRQITWDEKRTAGENARRELPALVSLYFSRVREELANRPTPARLHRLRLATKRLRYTLELFRPCYGPGLEARLAELRKVQQRLGELNDCVAAWDLLSKGMRRSPARTRGGSFCAAAPGSRLRISETNGANCSKRPAARHGGRRYLARSARGTGDRRRSGKGNVSGRIKKRPLGIH